MKNWYGGKYRDPLENLSREALEEMYCDVLEAHRDFTIWRDQAEATGRQIAAHVLNEERKRLAGIHADVRRKLGPSIAAAGGGDD